MGQYGSLIWIVVMIAMLYFLILRPQKKQQKERDAMLSAVKKGDRVVTIGGIHGIVRNIKEDRVTLEIASEVYVHFAKSAIGQVLKSGNSSKVVEEPEEDTAENTNDSLQATEAEDGDYVSQQDKDE